MYFYCVKEAKLISSTQNPLIKKIVLLKEKSRERKKTGLFVVEGQREVELALKGGYSIDTILYCTEIVSDFSQNPICKNPNIQFIQVSRSVYEKVAYRESTEGILGLVKAKEHTLENLQFKTKNPLILVAEAPEKPGNIGALLRTADAAAVDAVLIANPRTDLYNPNIIRSSVGCVFTNTIATGTTSEIISFLKEKDIKIFCAALTASKNYVECDFSTGAAIVVGTEATGLTEEWLQNSDQNIVIPMQGEIDSMNVSVSAAILIFEAKRQRGF
ncbi:TrmH family RNA methyltransferase [Flagellimonas sp.]|uniref:TrmH family RNA methyltransferase n=1 Tax=Flagellimonas sp. TaxID=2058762 RepID=UPI003B513CA7